MKANVTSIRIYRKWWHGILRRPTDLHYIHESNEVWMFDVKRKAWLPPQSMKGKE